MQWRAFEELELTFCPCRGLRSLTYTAAAELLRFVVCLVVVDFVLDAAADLVVVFVAVLAEAVFVDLAIADFALVVFAVLLAALAFSLAFRAARFAGESLLSS